MLHVLLVAGLAVLPSVARPALPPVITLNLTTLQLPPPARREPTFHSR